MALKVVPAGDERCDVHNRRQPQKHICETCVSELGIDPAPPPATRRARARRALRRWASRIDRKVLIGVGAGVLIAGVLLVVVLVAGGGGGNGQKDGLAAPEELVACLKQEGIQDVALSRPDAAGATAGLAVVSGEQDPLYGNIIELTYFGNPAEAEAYLDPRLLPTVSAHRERLADTVAAEYAASYGLAGPPELESIKGCLSQ
jgi:hypothetical protein